MYLYNSWGSHKLNFNFFNLRHTLLDTSLKKKITQIIRFLPLFSLTALFRNGTIVVFVLLYKSVIPFSFPYIAIFPILGYRLVVFAVLMLVCLGLRRVITEDGGEDGGWQGMAELKQLTTSELTTAITEEVTTITTWGSLSRRDSRRLQMSVNTFLFLTRYWHTRIVCWCNIMTWTEMFFSTY